MKVQAICSHAQSLRVIYNCSKRSCRIHIIVTFANYQSATFQNRTNVDMTTFITQNDLRSNSPDIMTSPEQHRVCQTARALQITLYTFIGEVLLTILTEVFRGFTSSLGRLGHNQLRS